MSDLTLWFLAILVLVQLLSPLFPIENPSQYIVYITPLFATIALVDLHQRCKALWERSKTLNRYLENENEEENEKVAHIRKLIVEFQTYVFYGTKGQYFLYFNIWIFLLVPSVFSLFHLVIFGEYSLIAIPSLLVLSLWYKIEGGLEINRSEGIWFLLGSGKSYKKWLDILAVGLLFISILMIIGVL